MSLGQTLQICFIGNASGCLKMEHPSCPEITEGSGGWRPTSRRVQRGYEGDFQHVSPLGELVKGVNNSRSAV